MRGRILSAVIGILSLGAALVAGTFAHDQYNRLVATADIVVPAVPIAPYTRITADMLQGRAVPRPLLSEPIYQSADELVGKISTVPLIPREPVYRAYAVALAQFRLSPDPALEVVSFPVDPAQAVGGQVRPGSRINLYRAAVRRPTDSPATQALSETLSTVDLLAPDVPVVDVRGTRGEPVRGDPASSEKASSSSGQPQQVALQIVTVAVPPQVAAEIVGLAAEQKAGVQLWVSLAPVTATVTSTAVITP